MKIINLAGGRLYVNDTPIEQSFYIEGRLYTLKPKQVKIIGGDGAIEIAKFLAYPEFWENRESILKQIEDKSLSPDDILSKYRVDPAYFHHPDTYRLKDAFAYAHKKLGKFSVLIIRDNASYVTAAGVIGGLGDVILASVIAKALKYNYGDSVRVMMKVMPKGKELMEHCPYVDDVYCDALIAEAQKPDITFCVNNLEFKIETQDIERGKQGTRNRTSIYLDLLDIPLENKTPLYVVRPEEERWAEEELAQRGFTRSRPIVALQLKGSNISRSWPEDKVFQLKERLEGEGFQVLLIDEMVKGLFRYTVTQTASLLKKCALCIAPNSFYFHLAGMIGIRSIALFGSVDAKVWVEDYEKTLPIDGSCPFHPKKCWWSLLCIPGPNMQHQEVVRSPECLANISVDEVMAAVALQMNPRKIAIVLLTYDCLSDTKKTIDSIRSFHDYKIFVMDNASTDGTQAWLEEKGIRCVSRKMSVTEAQNEGFRMALRESNPDYIFLLNNDVILSPTYLDTLVRTIERRQCAAVTGRVINSDSQNADKFHDLTIDIESPMREMVAGDFSAILMRRDIVEEKVGAVDEQFSPRYQEDEDYILRMRLTDADVIRDFNTTFYHTLGTTQANHPGEKALHSDNWHRNTGKFKAKWGFDCYSERGLYADLNAIKARCPDWQKKIFIPLEK